MELDPVYPRVCAFNSGVSYRTGSSKLDKKYNPSAEEPKVRKLGFGGLPPNGGSGNGGKGQKMSLKEATNAAWAETVKALGGEPMFGDDADE